jgi:hyperosmotically inducible protein
MKRLILASLLGISVAGASVVMADAPDSDHHYVKDSVITTKIKTKLAEKHLTSLTRIKVDTDAQGVVWLSGKAPTKDASDMAGLIAKDTDGVTSVHNDIVVIPSRDE